jgi:hypothetical protein
MRFPLTIITAAISVLLPACSSSAQTPDYRDACRVESDGRATGPSADICANVTRRWELLLATHPSPGVIRFVRQENYHSSLTASGWVLETPMPEPHPASPKYRTSDGLLRYFAEDIIPHEAGHQVFLTYVGELTAAATPEHYGSTAPDWIDEAPAVWMESRTLRQHRMRAVLKTKPSLATLVTMTHPGREFVRDNALSTDFHNNQRIVTPPCTKCTWLPDSLRKKYQIVDFGVRERGRPDTIVWYSDRNPNKVDTFEQREFYPLCYSLLRFLRLRGGAAAVHELIARYRENPMPRVGVLTALPGLPASVGALEKAWHEFLANPPPEDR